jgi:hypothetical protein
VILLRPTRESSRAGTAVRSGVAALLLLVLLAPFPPPVASDDDAIPAIDDQEDSGFHYGVPAITALPVHAPPPTPARHPTGTADEAPAADSDLVHSSATPPRAPPVA